MLKTLPTILALPLVLLSCRRDPLIPPPAQALQRAAGLQSDGLVPRTIPDEDPGPPFYARVGLQFFHSGGWIAIPFYRAPECVPAGFNLLQFFDFPGPNGPGAFACPLLVKGFLLIEPDATLGTFPRQVILREAGSVPFWFLPSATFETAAQDGVLTVSELEALRPLRGAASSYHETLHPREGEHKIFIDAAGLLEDGRTFRFHVTQIDERIEAIGISFR